MFNGSRIEVAMVATALAMALALVAALFACLGAVQERPAYQVAARRALYLNLPLVTLSFALLVAAFVASDFSVLYVAHNSNIRLPLVYRATAAWGAHEGSLMLWLLFLTAVTAAAVRLHRVSHVADMPWVVATLAALQAALIAFILLLSNPFTEVHPPLPEGKDLNPLLQDPGLIFHPPLLYLGYVGFSVPFAFAIAALIRGEAGSGWIRATRRWTLFSWAALTSGIFLGGYWSYYELGWGGYWAWDPVENASLMPWLAATAFLHSSMAQERRDLYRVWNLFLILATFCLSLMGTFLVRSGILTSVHAFAVDPHRGAWILAYLAAVMVVSFGLLAWRSPLLHGSPRGVWWASRESALLYNNLLFLVALATVFAGTLLPLLIEALDGSRISVAAPYFNRVMAPVMLCVLLLMGVGPAIPWRRAGSALFRGRLLPPLALALAAAALAGALGMRAWLALASVAALVFAASATGLDVIHETYAHAGNRGLLRAFLDRARGNRRRYGGLLVHFGVLVIALGLVGSGLFREEKTLWLAPGDSFAIGDYQIGFEGIVLREGPNYTARRAEFSVQRGDAPWRTLATERRAYPHGDMTTTEAGIASGLDEDLYLSYEGDLGDGRISLRAYRNPLVNWIWVGWLVVLAGAGLAMTARRPA